MSETTAPSAQTLVLEIILAGLESDRENERVHHEARLHRARFVEHGLHLGVELVGIAWRRGTVRVRAEQWAELFEAVIELGLGVSTGREAMVREEEGLVGACAVDVAAVVARALVIQEILAVDALSIVA